MSDFTPPRSAHDLTSGLIYFARMLDKMRLFAAGRLSPDYHDYLGDQGDPTNFDARCSRFLGLPYATIHDRVFAGGTDEEILEWCYENGQRPTEEEILIWNSFMRKRGWRDGPASVQLEEQKAASGLADRTDLVTYFDFQDADEGRQH